MNRLEIAQRTRSLVRDFGNSFFRDEDVTNYINEGIDRIGQEIEELREMPHLTTHMQEVIYLPKQFHHILALYCASRLCMQDERFFQAGTFMNEFETKLATLQALIESGEIDIVDEEGNVIERESESSYVYNDYFANKNGVIPNTKKNLWGD